MILKYWPIFLVIICDVLYQVCCKSTPSDANTLFSLIITYLTSAVVSIVLYFAMFSSSPVAVEMKKLSWTAPALGLIIVGVEVGYIYTYRNGITLSAASVLVCGGAAILLLFVGGFFYNEPLPFKKIAGVILCLISMYCIES